MDEPEAERPGVSRNQLERAGRRIREAARRREPILEQALEAIDAFRTWHLPTVRAVQDRLSSFFRGDPRSETQAFPITSRLKTTAAIVARLRRSTIALIRMQDVAGARIVVPTLESQDAAVSAVGDILFPQQLVHIKDQREEPDQYGYRAVHLIIRLDSRLAEIQLRTAGQDLWAQFVESIDSATRNDLKHGNGPAEWLEWLHALSDELRRGDLGQPYAIPVFPGDEEETEP